MDDGCSRPLRRNLPPTPPLPPLLRLSFASPPCDTLSGMSRNPGARTRSPTHAHMACSERRPCLGRSTFMTDSPFPLFPNTLTRSLTHARSRLPPLKLSSPSPSRAAWPRPSVSGLVLRVRDCGEGELAPATHFGSRGDETSLLCSFLLLPPFFPFFPRL